MPFLEVEPNLVTVQFYLNDLEPRFEGDAAKANWIVDNVIKRPLKRSYVVFFLRYRFDQLLLSIERASSRPGEPTDYLSKLAESVARQQTGWIQFSTAVAGLADWSLQRDIPLVMIIFPSPGRPGNAAVRVINQAAAALSQENGLPVIDLTDAFLDMDPAEQIVSEIDHHPSAALHRRAAEEIVRSLRAAELIPPSDQRQQ